MNHWLPTLGEIAKIRTHEEFCAALRKFANSKRTGFSQMGLMHFIAQQNGWEQPVAPDAVDWLNDFDYMERGDLKVRSAAVRRNDRIFRCAMSCGATEELLWSVIGHKVAAQMGLI